MTETQKNTWALTLEDTNVLKGIAILAMLLHHVYGCPPAGYGPFNSVLTFLGILGKVCVAIFLFCSGYGLSVKYGQLVDGCKEGFISKLKCTLKFLGRRFVKFYANYWFVFLIFVPISVFVFNRPLSAAYGENVNIYKHLCIDLLGIHSFNSYNITWWFNQLIIVFYLLFPGLFFCAKRCPLVTIVVSLLLMIVFGECAIYNFYGITYWQFPFMVGVLSAQYGLPKLFKRKTSHLSIILGVVGAGLIILSSIFFRFTYFRGIQECVTDVGIISGIVLILYSIKECRGERFLLPFTFMGKHATNIYLIHTFFLAYWFKNALYVCEVVQVGVFAALLAVCLVCSIALEWAKEKIRLTRLVSKINSTWK